MPDPRTLLITGASSGIGAATARHAVAAGFPERFASVEHGRSFCQTFFGWYNHEHYHSGIGYMTPAAMHTGQAPQLYKARQLVLDQAQDRHPGRFMQRHPVPPPLPTAVGINWPTSAPETKPQPERTTLNSLHTVSQSG